MNPPILTAEDARYINEDYDGASARRAELDAIATGRTVVVPVMTPREKFVAALNELHVATVLLGTESRLGTKQRQTTARDAVLSLYDEAARETIERCAKVCDAIAADNMKQDHVYSGDGDERFLYIATGARACIKAIRALSAARGQGAG